MLFSNRHSLSALKASVWGMGLATVIFFGLSDIFGLSGIEKDKAYSLIYVTIYAISYVVSWMLAHRTTQENSNSDFSPKTRIRFALFIMGMAIFLGYMWMTTAAR